MIVLELVIYSHWPYVSQEIYAAVYQDNDVKRRLLDKLYYERKRRLKRAIELQVEYRICTIYDTYRIYYMI